jgi:alcohol dehydrogenase
MKAARLYEVGKPLKVEEIAEPTLRFGSVIVRILCAHVFSYTDRVINGERQQPPFIKRGLQVTKPKP